jgi:hypothetical protein
MPSSTAKSTPSLAATANSETMKKGLAKATLFQAFEESLKTQKADLEKHKNDPCEMNIIDWFAEEFRSKILEEAVSKYGISTEEGVEIWKDVQASKSAPSKESGTEGQSSFIAATQETRAKRT